MRIGGRTVNLKSMISFLSSANRLAIELQDGQIKLVNINFKKGVPRLTDACIVPVPEGIVKESEKWQRFVGETIKKFLKTRRLKNAEVICMPPEDSLLVIVRSIAAVSAKELQNAAKLTLKSHFPKDINNFYYDSYPKNAAADENNLLNLTIVGASAATIDRLARTLIDAGCRLKAIAYPGLAYENLLTRLNNCEKDKAVLIINIGQRKTTFFFFSNENLQFYKEDDSLNQEQIISSALAAVSGPKGITKLTQNEAKQLMQRYGIEREDGEEEVTGKRMSLFQFASMLRPYVEKIASKTRNYIAYYKQRHNSSNVSRIFLCGFARSLKGLDLFLTSALNIKAEPVPVSRCVDTTSEIREEDRQFFEDNPHCFDTLIASTLGKTFKINLLSWNHRSRSLAYSVGKIVSILAPVVLSILILFHVRSAGQIQEYQKIISRRQIGSEIFQMTISQSELLTDINREIEQYKGIIQYIKPNIKPTPLWLGMFTELSNLIPDNIALVRLLYEKQDGIPSLLLNGKIIRTADPESRYSIHRFAKKLDASPFFKNVKFILQQQTQKTEDPLGLMNFELTYELR